MADVGPKIQKEWDAYKQSYEFLGPSLFETIKKKSDNIVKKKKKVKILL